jgi:hypothetical protein
MTIDYKVGLCIIILLLAGVWIHREYFGGWDGIKKFITGMPSFAGLDPISTNFRHFGLTEKPRQSQVPDTRYEWMRVGFRQFLDRQIKDSQLPPSSILTASLPDRLSTVTPYQYEMTKPIQEYENQAEYCALHPNAEGCAKSTRDVI